MNELYRVMNCISMKLISIKLFEKEKNKTKQLCFSRGEARRIKERERSSNHPVRLPSGACEHHPKTICLPKVQWKNI